MFIKAQLASLSASIIDYSTFLLLNKLFHVPGQLATAAGVTAGGIFNFTVNRRWVFAGTEKNRWGQAAKYILVWCGNFCLNVGGYKVLSQTVNWDPAIIKVLVSLTVGLSYNYILQKRFVFK